MMRIAMAALLLGVAACGSSATATSGEPGMGVTNVVYAKHGRVPEGATFWVKIDQKLSAKNNRRGDSFSGHVTQSLNSPNGEVLIPKGANVYGHIAQLQRKYEGEQAVIVLDFDSLEMDGVRQPLRGHITATDVPSTAERIKGKHVGIGAAAGAVVGGLIKGWGGALVGAAIGAAGGSAISLGMSGGEETLPRGTKVAVALDRPVTSLAMIRRQGGYY